MVDFPYDFFVSYFGLRGKYLAAAFDASVLMNRRSRVKAGRYACECNKMLEAEGENASVDQRTNLFLACSVSSGLLWPSLLLHLITSILNSHIRAPQFTYASPRD